MPETAEIVYKPNSRRQEQFLSSKADITIYGGARGGGKLLPLDTPLPTPNGWSTMGLIRVGDELFDETGKICRVTAISGIDPSPVMYRLEFDDGSTQEACEHHQWVTMSKKERISEIRRSKEFKSKRRANRPSCKQTGKKTAKFTESLRKRNAERQTPGLPVPTGTIRNTKEISLTLMYSKKEVNHSIRTAGPLAIPVAVLPVPPYVMGAWLGDGTAGSGGMTGIDADIFRQIEAEGYTVTHSKKNSQSHYIQGLAGHLRTAGVLHHKHIPTAYLRASRQQRVALLQGLMDTDGTVAKNSGAAEFCNTNKEIIDGVYELIVSLGWRARVCPGRSKLNGIDHGPKWTIKWMPGEIVFRLPRKSAIQGKAKSRVTRVRYIVACTPTESKPGRCITVDSPSSMYLCGRSMIPTHNTYGLQLESTRHIHRPNFYGALLRSTLTAIKRPGGMWDEGYSFYHAMGGNPNRSDHSWRFPSGARLVYGHLETQSSVESWRGAQVGFLGIDQLETISEYAFWAVLGSVRGATGVRSYIRATCNPDPDCFLYKNGSPDGLITWWINTDTGYPYPERAGVVRWFIRHGDDLVWGDPADLQRQYPGTLPMSVSFIPATVYDNSSLMRNDPGYEARLMAMPLVERLRMLGGNWKIKAAAGTTLRAEWFQPKPALPDRWLRLVRVWDLAGTVPSRENPDPDWTAGVLMGMDEQRKFWILDVNRFRKSTAHVELEIARQARLDGRNVKIYLEQEGGSAGIGWPDSIIRNHLTGFSAERRRPVGSKLTRVQILGSAAEHGKVFTLDNDRLAAPWLSPFLSECQTFTDGSQPAHDDQVDAASAALIILSMGEGLYEPFESTFTPDRNSPGMHTAPPGVFREEPEDMGRYDDDDYRQNWPGLNLGNNW